MPGKRLFFLSLISILLTLNLAGCGFKLETQNNLPPQLHKLHLTSNDPYNDFVQILRSNLIHRNITLVNSKNQAPFTLTVNGINLTTSQTSIGTSQQTREYSIVYHATFAIVSKQDKTIVGPFKLSANTSQTMFSGQLITNSSQLDVTKRQLQREVIKQLFYKLASTDTQKAITEFTTKPKQP